MDQEWIFRDKINQIFAEQMSNWAEILNISFKKSWIPYKEITKDWIFRDKINQNFAEQMNWAGKGFMIWRSQNNNVKQRQKKISDWNHFDPALDLSILDFCYTTALFKPVKSKPKSA